ncbi:hypothetical protein [Motilimonas eburnea]|uniref:hypothetical protein n=1 Tax=Motilimonas eburnea TaxID=1737488 RepID=UPI001E53C57B|nr:hypothetical protein [Motilimonas eburnea]MCE2571680.1 hypothetical protein [Motilimonas eburnea]
MKSQLNHPTAYFYYGKKFVGASIASTTPQDAFKQNMEYTKSLDLGCLPYLRHCTHVEIVWHEQDKAVILERDDPNWEQPVSSLLPSC